MEHYYRDVQAIIYVMDSTDRIRMAVARDELEQLLTNEAIAQRPIPILFFANKMDLPGSLDASDIAEQLELDAITDRPWHIEHTNALTGRGVEEGITWMASQSAVAEGTSGGAAGSGGPKKTSRK